MATQTLTRFEQDVLGQPRTLAQVVEHHFGPGATALDEAATMLRGARRIVLSGMGSSLYALYPCLDLLNANGHPAVLVETSEALHYGREMLRDAAVVLVSRSGETVETLKLVPVLREAGARVVGVSNVTDSTLARESDAFVWMASLPDEMIALQSYTASLAVLALLAARAAGVSLREDLDSIVAASGGVVEEAMRRADEWQSFLHGAPCVYLLGRGPSLASVHEGALLFHEAAKFPAVGMSAGNFRHGPVEVVEAGYRAIVFCSQDRTVHLETSLARDLERFGGRVIRIGPDGEYRMPRVHSALAPVLEIVPVQAAACRLAQVRGWRPGQFRYAQLITASEESFGAGD